MSYQTITQSSRDQSLVDRITAATVQEAWQPGQDGNDYAGNVRQSAANAHVMTWPVVIASDVEAAYASALAAGNQDPGGDPSVITDGMILANVQAKWPDEVAP
jgi:hypothetical protein